MFLVAFDIIAVNERIKEPDPANDLSCFSTDEGSHDFIEALAF